MSVVEDLPRVLVAVLIANPPKKAKTLAAELSMSVTQIASRLRILRAAGLVAPSSYNSDCIWAAPHIVESMREQRDAYRREYRVAWNARNRKRMNREQARQCADEELERWLAAEPVRRIVPAAGRALPIIPLPVRSVFDLAREA